MTITKSGELASFYTVNKAPIKHLRVYFSPKQAGEGDPSPSNVREISGWNEIELNYTGLNCLNMGYGKFDWIVPQCYLNKTVTYSGYIDNTNGTKEGKLSFRFYDKNNTNLLTGLSNQAIAIGSKGYVQVIFTITADVYKITFNASISTTANVSNRQLTLENGKIDYKSYKNQNQTIDWANDIGTIYGGYMDLITGELVQEYDYISKPWKNWGSATILGNNTRKACATSLAPIGGNAAAAVSLCNLTNNYLWSNSDDSTHFYVANSSNTIYAILPNTLDENQEIQISYKLKTPIVHQLTPTQLSTLIGQNNIWSNADRVEIEYDLAESNDELYRRRNIILGGYPHIETASGDIASFSTDIAAPLKEAKVYFEPVQEGEGDPSPENIRPISGWNNVNLFSTGKNILNPQTNPIWNNGNYTILQDDGVIVKGSDGRGWTSTQISPLELKKGTYTFTWVGSKRIQFATSEDNYATVTSYSAANLTTYKSFTFTLSTDGGIKWKHTGDSSDYPITVYVQIEPTNIGTSYESYNGILIPINWENDIGTIYGGYVDLISGKLIRDWCINTHEIAASDGTPGGTGTGGNTNYRFIAWNLPSAHLSDSSRTKLAVCNIAPYSTSQGGTRFWIGGGTVYMVLPNDNQAYSAIVVYAERDLNVSTYQLTLTQLKTLKGQNNIWSNSNGPIDIKYWTH